MLSHQKPTAEIFWDTPVSETVPSAGWSPTCLQKHLHQITLEDRAACATILWLTEGTFFAVIHHAGRDVLCLLIDNHLPLETRRTWISVQGYERRFTLFPCLKLPSSVILVWSISGTRSSSFLQMQIRTWKPSFSLPTHLGVGIFHLLLK